MKILRNLFAYLLLMVSSVVLADDYAYLTVVQTGAQTNFSINNIKNITFDANYMLLNLNDDTQQKLPLSELSKMFFSQESSGIASLTTMKSKIRFAGGILRATVEAGERIAIYNMKGERVFSANESGSYDLSGYARGVYIIKVGAETKKVINK